MTETSRTHKAGSTTGKIPVTVLTGFLGSGKTTVLNHVVQQPDMKNTLVLINEFGEIGLDHDLVTQSDEDFVVEMSSGCLCCSIRGDLLGTLRTAPDRFVKAGRPVFDRVIIETTGLADPAPILHTLMTAPAIVSRYSLDGVVTTIDAVNGEDTMDRQHEAVKQAAVADRLLITKTDIADAGSVQRLKAALRILNPGARQSDVIAGKLDADMLVGMGLYTPETKTADVQAWLGAEAFGDSAAHTHNHDHDHHNHDHHSHDNDHDHHHHDVNRHDANIKAVCVTLDDPVDGAAMDMWLGTLVRFRGADLLRVKGIINVAGFDRPVVIHGVQHTFHPETVLDAWPSEDRRTRIVFITRGISDAELHASLASMTAGQDATGQDATGQDATGQDATGQDATG